MKQPVLYSFDMSPPCRTVLLAAKAIGVEMDIQEVNLLKKDNLKPEFIKINSQHTIPTLNDDGFILWDSHAIICYLSEKYGKNDKLYPKDLKKRAIIDQRLHFDSGILFPLIRGMAKPLFFENQRTLSEEKLELLKDAYKFLNKFLDGEKWLAGDSYTLADISCVASISSLTAFLPIDSYPNIVNWLKTCETELPGYAEQNLPGITKLHAAVKKILHNP